MLTHVSQERNITDLILKNLAFGSKYFDVAMVCAVDICRAASRVRPRPDHENEIPLISMAYDFAHELKVKHSSFATLHECLHA